MSDDDGHDYLIPVGREKAFEAWIAAGPYWEGYEGEDFEEARISGSVEEFSFTDPYEDSIE